MTRQQDIDEGARETETMDWYWWLLILLIVAILIWRLLLQLSRETPAAHRSREAASGPVADTDLTGGEASGTRGTTGPAQAGVDPAAGVSKSHSTSAEEFIAPSSSSFESHAASDDLASPTGPESGLPSQPARDEAVPTEPAGSESVDEAAPLGPYGLGSATPDPTGTGPAGWGIKATEGSKLYHTPDSPDFGHTRADVWFEDEARAVAAGFQRWDQEG